MSATTLSEIKAAVETLDLPDQVRLLEYLTPKVARAVLAAPHAHSRNDDLYGDVALRHYRSLGERLAATSTRGAPSLTDAVSEMRR
jgi:hypothetical protein